MVEDEIDGGKSVVLPPTPPGLVETCVVDEVVLGGDGAGDVVLGAM